MITFVKKPRTRKPRHTRKFMRKFRTMSPETVTAIDRSLARIQTDGVCGDYYEFGLFRGYTFWQAQELAGAYGLGDMRFFGFDSFEGLPEVVGVDVGGGFRRGDYACGIQEVRSELGKRGIDWGRTELVKGYYEDSLTRQIKESLNMGPAALVLVDCDLYRSAVSVLDFMDDLIQDGTIVLFDDWNCFDASEQRGERRAFREFLGRRQHWRAEFYMNFGWHGRGFVLTNKESQREENHPVLL